MTYRKASTVANAKLCLSIAVLVLQIYLVPIGRMHVSCCYAEQLGPDEASKCYGWMGESTTDREQMLTSCMQAMHRGSTV